MRAKIGNVLLVDDDLALHDVVQDYFGHRWRIHSAYNVWQAGDLLHRIERLDLALVDLHLDGPIWPRCEGGPGSGFHTVQVARSVFPGALVAVFSAYSNHELINVAQRLGAEYVVKHRFSENLALLEARIFARRTDAHKAYSLEGFASRHCLSPREIQVLALLTSGLCYEDIGSLLEITVTTVKNHVSSILDKVKGVESRYDVCLKVYLERQHAGELRNGAASGLMLGLGGGAAAAIAAPAAAAARRERRPSIDSASAVACPPANGPRRRGPHDRT